MLFEYSNQQDIVFSVKGVLYCGNLLSILSVLFVFHRLDPSSIFTTAYTSGSTSAPKGCVFTTNTWNSRIT